MTLSKILKIAALILIVVMTSKSSFSSGTHKQKTVSDSSSLKGSFKPLYMHLAKSIRYPKGAREHNVTGTIVISFDLTTDGNVANIAVLNAEEVKKNGYGIDQEVISQLATFKDKNKILKPGSYFIPVTFKLAGLPEPQPLDKEFKNRPNCLGEIVVTGYSGRY